MFTQNVENVNAKSLNCTAQNVIQLMRKCATFMGKISHTIKFMLTVFIVNIYESNFCHLKV